VVGDARDVEEISEDEWPISSLAVPTQTPTDAPTRRDRMSVTWALFALVTVGGATMFVAAFQGDPAWGRVERASALLLTPLMTLLSTAVGWYFGSRSPR